MSCKKKTVSISFGVTLSFCTNKYTHSHQYIHTYTHSLSPSSSLPPSLSLSLCLSQCVQCLFPVWFSSPIMQLLACEQNLLTGHATVRHYDPALFTRLFIFGQNVNGAPPHAWCRICNSFFAPFSRSRSTNQHLPYVTRTQSVSSRHIEFCASRVFSGE